MPAARFAAVDRSIELTRELPVVDRGVEPELDPEGPRLWLELVPARQDVLPGAGLPGGDGLEA